MDEYIRAYPDMDPTTIAVLKAASISADMLPSLSKEDLRDLFPGPEHFFRRRDIWRITHDENEGEESGQLRPGNSSGTCNANTVSSISTPLSSPSSSSTPLLSSNPRNQHGTSRTVQLVSPQYIVYTDTELEQSKSIFFEKQRAGQEGDYTLSKDLRCRLIRNTVTSMIAIKRAARDEFQYPCSRELTVMAKRLIEYYPMLRDKSAAGGAEWESVKKQLLKRVQNVTTPKKKQGATPSRKRRRALSFESSSSSQETLTDDSGSTASTLILERSPQSRCSSPEAEQVDGSETTDSPQNQARHYKILQELYKSKPRPNKKDVAQLLDFEYQARRAYIDSDVLKEQDRPAKILQAYPCFRELDHIMNELRRILDQENSHYIPELKNRWETFYEKAQFYGVFKKVMRPPLSDKVKQFVAVIKALPDLFPSTVAPHKKLGHASAAMLHILKSAEDPNTFLQVRPLSSPVVIVCETNCILAIGTMPVLIFPKEDLSTEVLMDSIHDRDMTSSYKKAMAEWKKFITE
ncbi:uncharacterized protein LOC114556733 [Perca flavescens]|uniref:uncharacterized protein LOC114556733 n=1 Tax=Perca flavescens TaxID=8167 RepID=UPI00106E4351|nr:uncharacterized protein LOC114556733 [Perca flavescens]